MQSIYALCIYDIPDLKLEGVSETSLQMTPVREAYKTSPVPSSLMQKMEKEKQLLPGINAKLPDVKKDDAPLQNAQIII